MSNVSLATRGNIWDKHYLVEEDSFCIIDITYFPKGIAVTVDKEFKLILIVELLSLSLSVMTLFIKSSLFIILK